MSGEATADAAKGEGMGKPDREWARDLSKIYRSEVVGHPLLAYDETASTNDVVKKLAEQGAPEGLVVVSRAQTRGRGRRGRTWVTFAGKAVYLSALIRPGWPALEAGWLGILGGLAAADAIKRLGVEDVTIKWPNDVLVNGAKIGGVLVEPRVSDERLEFAVIGIGINVTQQAKDWPPELAAIATSCRMEGVDVTCDRVIAELIERLDAWYQRMNQEGRDTALKDWSSWSDQASLPTLE
jgi:BirA family biotin operon repressor/biotin-[acetyl-CoA-carboxylase] ligase